MKQIVLTLAAVLTISVSTVLANAEPVPDSKAKETFKKEFAGAKMVTWSNEGQYTKASFVLGESRVVALFNEQGDLLGSVRNLFFSQLPLSVINGFETRFSKAIVLDITEVNNSEGTRYRFTIELKGKKYSATFYADGSVENTRRVK